MDRVDITAVKKALKKVPKFVIKSLQQWVLSVHTIGLVSTQKLKGYHDEPLKGKRHGQRSVRLNRKWRLIYSLQKNGSLKIVKVEEITPHDYRVRK